jgi:hypothetical protein
MASMLAAEVWHYWISIPLVLGTIGLVVALAVGYVTKVVAPKYPKR